MLGLKGAFCLPCMEDLKNMAHVHPYKAIIFKCMKVFTIVAMTSGAHVMRQHCGYNYRHHPVSRVIGLGVGVDIRMCVLEISAHPKKLKLVLHHCQCMTNTIVNILLTWYSEVHHILVSPTHPPTNGGRWSVTLYEPH